MQVRRRLEVHEVFLSLRTRRSIVLRINNRRKRLSIEMGKVRQPQDLFVLQGLPLATRAAVITSVVRISRSRKHYPQRATHGKPNQAQPFRNHHPQRWHHVVNSSQTTPIRAVLLRISTEDKSKKSMRTSKASTTTTTMTFLLLRRSLP